MAIIINNVRINNLEYDGSAMLVPYIPVIFNWSWTTSKTTLRQMAYEIRIGTHKVNWGQSGYLPDIFRKMPTKSSATSWRLPIKYINRNTTYYGQIRVQDNTGSYSKWAIFSFTINQQPFVINGSISPSEPSLENSLSLDFSLTKSDASVNTRWFKNGIHQEQFDNYVSVSSDYMRYLDTWIAEITPVDNIEYGPTFTTQSVKVSKKPPVASELTILPLDANNNDILEANYVIIDPNINNVLLHDRSEIRWYVNNVLIESANNYKFVRLELKPNDSVFFTIVPSDGQFDGEMLASTTKIIQDAGFRIYNLKVDGFSDNLMVASVNPTVEWSVVEAFRRKSKYAKIQIGTTPGANNIYENIIETFDETFVVPDNVVERGVDYYVSVSASDTKDSFEHKLITRFRVAGSRWQQKVSNENGWTIEVALQVEGEGYQKISIGDGTRFAEIRFSATTISAFLGAGDVRSANVDMSFYKNIVIAGKKNTIKIYNGNNLIIDGTDSLLISATEKFIEIGSPGNSEAVGSFKRIVYTTADAFYPDESSVYSQMHFEPFIDFVDGSVSSMVEHEGDILASLNPDNDTESGAIYRIVETANTVLGYTETVDSFDIQINKLSLSPNEKYLYIAHSNGASFFENYFIPKYDIDSKFYTGIDPSKDNWELVRTITPVSNSYSSDGIIIDTTYINTGDSDQNVFPEEHENVAAIRLSCGLIDSPDYIFKIIVDGSVARIIGVDRDTTAVVIIISLTKSSHTVQDLVDAINNETSEELNSFVSAEVLNGCGNQSLSNLYLKSATVIYPSLTVFGVFSVIDPYTVIPYSSVSGGKWFYTHRKHGTPWFERVSNTKGWTVDFNVSVEVVEDSDRPSDEDKPLGFGLYVNDGSYYETIYFLQQEIILNNAKKSTVFDTSNVVKYRITGKNNKIKLFAKQPTDTAYNLLAESAFTTKATNQANAGRPAVALDGSGILHAVWHDDGNGGRRQLFYSYINTASGNEWSQPELIVLDDFGAANPDIAVDNNGEVYVVFETMKADYTDIAVITKNELGWSEPYIISVDVNHSINPKVAVDDRNNVHVVWEDYRSTEPEIFYCTRNAADGQWISSAFGRADTRVTDSENGARKPAIAVFGTNVYVSWTGGRADGTTGIYISYNNSASKKWFSSGQGELDFSATSQDSEKADFSDIIVDAAGRVFVAWHDIIDGNYQIFARRINSFLTIPQNIIQITQGNADSRFPQLAFNRDNGDIYAIWEKEQHEASDPYNPYFGDVNSNEIHTSASIYVAKHNAKLQIWESSNQTFTKNNIKYGGFDVRIDSGDARESRRPSVASNYSGDMHILYEAKLIAEYGEVLPHTNLFTVVRDAVFENDYVRSYSLTGEATNPYSGKDLDLSGTYLRKEIRWGDFSESTGGKFIVNNVKYYLEDAVDPFTVKLISSATTNMKSANVLAVASNNDGDAWLGTDNGMIFYKRRSNEVVLLNSEDYNIKGVSINDIVFDNKHNMYISTENGVYASIDHLYFWNLKGLVPSKSTCLDIDKYGRLYVGSDEGVFIFDSNNIVNNIKMTSVNAVDSNREIDVTESVHLSTNNILPSNTINAIKIDANNVAWIGTNKGLVRYIDGKSTIITQRNGLSSNKVISIAIRNTAIRYVATTAGIDKMLGINVEPLDFENINLSVKSNINNDATQIIPDVQIPVFGAVRAVVWRDPNILYVSSAYELYQITFIDEAFGGEQTQISRFGSEDYALISIITERNDDLQTYKLVGVEDLIIPDNAVFEVYLNGNPIFIGYKFSPKYQTLRFEYPLKKSDIVTVKVRFDVLLLNKFTQNKAQQIAEGIKATDIEKIISAGNNIYVLTDKDTNSIQINDFHSDLPYDRIILDATPPVGRIRIKEQVDRTVVRVAIEQIDEYTPFDATSGIDKLIVSNFTNFTDDGEIAQDPQAFITSLTQDLGAIFDNVTRQYAFSKCLGRRLGRWDRVGNSQVMVAGTASPANLYIFNPIEDQWELKTTFDDANHGSRVNFIITFNGKLVVGTGNDFGSGKVYTSVDGNTFELIASVPVRHAYCAKIMNNVLYIGCGGLEGILYRFDGEKFEQLFANVSGAIYDLAIADNVLYAATGDEGRIYRLDPAKRTQQIMHVDYDSKIISIETGTFNDTQFVFAGTETTAKIVRHKVPNAAFVHSFKTVAGAVNSLANINGKVYASIDNTLFVLDGVWQAKFTNSEDILDVVSGPNNVVWFISDGFVSKIEDLSDIRNVYLKMFDKAGNETSLYLDEAKTKLDPNLFDSIKISDMIGFVNNNRILEVDEFGNTVFIYEGSDRFYSADKVDEEIGVYFSEIFNGTNSIVSWSRISWDAVVPSNTEMKIYIRTATNRDDLLDAKFSIVFDSAENPADISYLSNQYLQFKVVMKSRIRNISPSLRKVTVKSIASDSTHFFTTNFVMPSRVKSGILTSKKMIPVAADIIFGISTNNTVDFSEYQIIDENRIFTTDDRQVGNGLRVGVRLLTPSRGETISPNFGEYGPYDSNLMFNSVEWNFANNSSETKSYHFRVGFYEDFALTNLVWLASTMNSVVGFSDNGDLFTDAGAELEISESGHFSYTPTGDNTIVCNTFYFVKVEVYDDGVWKILSDSESFVEACGTTFVDEIDFDFTNQSVSNTFNFRIRFYDNAERTSLVRTVYSGNDVSNWFIESEDFPVGGHVVLGGASTTITYKPVLPDFTTGVIYYLSIDAFDGEKFITNSNSFTFKVRDIISDIYCGEYMNVPVLKNFAIMWELENGQFVTLRLDQ